MCYIIDWPKRFLKTFLQQISHHQVKDGRMIGFLIVIDDLIRGLCVCQVELLIDNEAEKDYLYDVLRMYHQWVHSKIMIYVFVCVAVI